MCAPTGFGKSLSYMALGKMSGLRTVVLTSTKGLQDQLQRDFDAISSDIRGQTAYYCPIAPEMGYSKFTYVADAPCQYGYSCSRKASGCEYFDRYRVAQEADIVVTNYACWLFDTLRREGLDSKRAVDQLILDEAHDAPEELASFLKIELVRKEVLSLGMDWPASGFEQDEWREWGGYWQRKAKEKIELLQGLARDGDKTSGREMKEWKKIERKLGGIQGMQGEWVIEEKDGGRSVHFDPLWPQHYAESKLFRGIPKVVLVSATVRPKTLELCGIPAETSVFQEYSSTFPRASRPVIHVPTVRMNHKTDDNGLMWWLRRIDQIIEQRQDRKGIIHTVSYARARLIKDNSRFSSMMLVHGSDNAKSVIESFKQSSKPCVLLSPSISTGYDFPYQQCEYQVIGKLPFPDTRNRVLQARTRNDKEYTNYLVAQVLQQATGRGMRAEDDKCETIIIDDNVGWFVAGNRQHFNKWWLEAYRKEGMMPKPLEKLTR